MAIRKESCACLAWDAELQCDDAGRGVIPDVVALQATGEDHHSDQNPSTIDPSFRSKIQTAPATANFDELFGTAAIRRNPVGRLVLGYVATRTRAASGFADRHLHRHCNSPIWQDATLISRKIASYLPLTCLAERLPVGRFIRAAFRRSFTRLAMKEARRLGARIVPQRRR